MPKCDFKLDICIYYAIFEHINHYYSLFTFNMCIEVAEWYQNELLTCQYVRNIMSVSMSGIVIIWQSGV